VRDLPLGPVHLIFDVDVADALPDASDLVERLLGAGLPSLQLRAPGRTPEERLRRGTILREQTARAGALFVVNGDVDAAIALGADGVHLPAHGPSAAEVRPRLPSGMLLGASGHDAREVARAAGADWVLLAPVFATRSKPGAATLGAKGFGELAALSTAPAYALGGVDFDNVAECFDAGAAGIAAIRSLLDPRGPDLVTRAFALAR